MTTNNEEKKGLEIIEEDEFENEEITEEELQQFYEENKDAIDLVGGLDMFESLMNLSDEQFITLKPHFLALFNSTLNESATEKELYLLIASQDFTLENIEEELKISLQNIDEIDFLSEEKKDGLALLKFRKKR